MPTVHEPRIGVVVVAYNAASTLLQTLDRIPDEFARRVTDILIFDDASTDETFHLGSTWAHGTGRPPTLVVRHTKNLGYGGNQKAAYTLAIERELDVVVLLHGDGQYAPEILGDMVAPIIRGECEAVFGSRMMTKGAARAGGMPMYKWLGNRILSTFANKMLKTDLSEFHSGYRAYSVDALRAVPFTENTDDFDFDTQIILQFLHAGHRIVEIPIPTYYGDEICHVNGLKYAKDVVRDLAEYQLAVRGFGTPTWVDFSQDYAQKHAEGSSHATIQEMLAGSRPLKILDLGCSTGTLGEALRGAGHHVTGVDVYESPGVRDRLDDFHVADLATGIPDRVGADFDLIIAADVIEHLPKPVETLRRMRELLGPNGQVLLSVPNFGHWYPRTRVAFGRFGYDRRGILDDTHLRFFTRRTLRRTVMRGGFDVMEERVTGLPIEVVSDADGRVKKALARVDKSLVRTRPTLFGYQFVLRLTRHAEGQEHSGPAWVRTA
jgi:glycosyltransferase involved in cell wall biosynthesis